MGIPRQNPSLLERARLTVLPWLLPRIVVIRRSEWDAVLVRLRDTPFDALEKAGLVLSLAFATYLLGADSTLAAERSLPVVYIFQFVVAVPLLIVLAGPLYLRCWRRGLEQEIALRERRRQEQGPKA